MYYRILGYSLIILGLVWLTLKYPKRIRNGDYMENWYNFQTIGFGVGLICMGLLLIEIHKDE